MENDEITTTVSSKVAFANGSDEATHETPAATEQTNALETSNTSLQDKKIENEGLTVGKGQKGGQEASSDDTPEVRKVTETSTSSGSATSFVPPVKRFTAVNITKKFFEKTSSITPAGSHSLSNTSSRPIGTVCEFAHVPL